MPTANTTPRSRLRTDFSWVLAGNVLYSACQWGIVVVLAKLGNPAQVGEYAFGLAVAVPIVLFANVQLRGLLVSDVKGQFTFGQYLGFRVVTLAAALVVVLGAAAFTHSIWRLKWIVVLSGFAQALELVSDLYYGYMQLHGRMDRISRSLMFKGPLSVGALCIAMYLTRNVLWALAALALGRLVILLAWDSRTGFAKPIPWVAETDGSRALRIKWDWVAMRTILITALPLGVSQMLTALNISIPRYFVEGRFGAAELGIFSAIASLLTAGNLVIAAFGQSIFLLVAQACAAADTAAFRRYVGMAALLGAVIGGGALIAVNWFGPQLLAHVFRPEYGRHGNIMMRLMIAGTVGFVASGMGYIMTAARCLRPQIPQLTVSVIAAAVASAWLIPSRGLTGAADAMLIAAVVQLLGALSILWSLDHKLRSRGRANNEIGADQQLEQSAVSA